MLLSRLIFTLLAVKADSQWVEATNYPTGKTWKSVQITSDGSMLVGAARGGIYYSRASGDGFPKWSFVYNGDFRGLAISADGSKMVAGVYDSGGSLWVTSDSGSTWNETTPSSGYTGYGVYDQGICMSADGSKVVALGESKGAAMSTDSGNTWTKIAFDGAHTYFTSSSIGFLFFFFFVFLSFLALLF